MNIDSWESNHFMILAYIVSGLLLWGYAVLLWKDALALKKRRAADES